MARVFYGGQIREDCKGDLAAVITRENSECCAFLYPVGSEEFNNLTGVRASKHPPIRVYIGINNRTGGEIASRVHDSGDLEGIDIFLERIDISVVYPYFTVKEERERPSKIVLESTSEGYKIV